MSKNFNKQEMLEYYYANNAAKLRNISDKILLKYGGNNLRDYEDFYSIANEVFADNLGRYDGSCKFRTFLINCLENKFKSELTRRNRQKRKGDNDLLSVDQAFQDDGLTLGETISSDYNIENVLLEEMECGYSDRVENYLNSLSELPCKVAKLIMQNYSESAIKAKLNLTDKQYRDCLKSLRSYKNKRILYKDNNMEDEEMRISMEDVAESYKNTSYSIESISKQLRKKRIRDDHILQRHSGQWLKFAKSALISDILRGKSLTQIIISEEIKNGLRMQWLIDGKQRCTTLDEFLHDEFSISKNIKNHNIRYQVARLDENGNEILNEEGFPEIEYKEFDIRGKKFSQLPEELQDIFKDRQIPVLYNMNCTKKDIAEDIARFNRSRPMNKAQSGWLGLDESFAELVENIAKMQFFQPYFAGSKYTDNNQSSGLIRRTIVEAIMVSDFIEDFSRDFDKMCEFLSEEASDSNFTEFYVLIERLSVISKENIAHLFNGKDSFLWFSLFSKFAKLRIDDEKFIGFMEEFDNKLRHKIVDGVKYEDLCINRQTGKALPTKDKSIVIKKINLLEKLMMEYLHITVDEEYINDERDIDISEFIQENVNSEMVKEDIEFYTDIFNDLTINVNNTSKLLDEKNKPSLIALTAYACENDIDLDSWIVDFFATNSTYKLDQKENYLYMKENLNNYIRK